MTAPAALDTLFVAETPEGIGLSLRPAGLVARSGAFAIDLVIRIAVIGTASGLLATLGHFGGGLFMLLFFALEWFYPVAFELALGGATPGKRALGLQVVMDSGLPVTPAASLLRNLLRAADFLPFGYAFGLLAMLLRADFKRLGDLAAGTLVVHRSQARLGGPLPQAEPEMPARALDRREQAAVLAWAGRASRITDERLAELAQLAAPILAEEAKTPAAARAHLLGVAQWLWGHR